MRRLKHIYLEAINDIGLKDAPCHSFAINLSGQLRFCNIQLCHSLGYSNVELQNKKADILFPIASKIFFETHLSPILRMKGEAAEIFLPLQDRDKRSVPILWNISSVNRENEVLFVFVGLLQVNRDKFEKELVRARKQAIEALDADPEHSAARLDANKYMEEIESQWRVNAQQTFDLAQFNRVLGHDIREPLRKILLYVGMLKNFSEENSIYQREVLLDKVINASQALGKLADNLQNITSFETETPDPIEIDVIKTIETALSKVQQKYPELKFDLETLGTLTVWADDLQIQSLFYFLLLNAVQYRTSEVISLSVSVDSIGQNEFKSGKGGYRLKETGRIRFTSQDFILGDSSLGHVLDLFKSLKAGSQESFYLSMVKKIVEQNNGNLVLETVPEKGSIFILFLPIKDF